MKIFVGGLPHDLSHEEFKSFFERFGTVIDSVIIHKKETREPRGFGFVTFDSEEAAEKVLQNQFYDLKNKSVEVKRAKPKEQTSSIGGSSSISVPFYPNLGPTQDLSSACFIPFGLTYPPYYPVYYCQDHYGTWYGFGQNPFHMYEYGHPDCYGYSNPRFGQNYH